MIVDSHCHLDYPGLAEREAEVLANAAAAGVDLMVTIATRRSSWGSVKELASRHGSLVCALGIHPHHAGEDRIDDPRILIEAARHPEVVAIGETGLDFFYDYAPREAQAQSFRTHIEAARATGLPLIVHTREADAETMAILEEEMVAGPFTGVVHCYSSSRELAERAVAIGLYLGIGGILTFRKSEAIRATVADMPIERLLLETDAPYLAPVPKRGRTNEPAFTAHVAKALAELRGVGLAEIERITTENFFRLFTRAQAHRQAA
jgi:TatD DNase family protein